MLARVCPKDSETDILALVGIACMNAPKPNCGDLKMGAFSIWHWLIVLAVVLVLFGGGGKISKLMGDFGKGLKFFKKNIKEEDTGEDESEPVKAIASDATSSAMDAASEEKKDRAANS